MEGAIATGRETRLGPTRVGLPHNPGVSFSRSGKREMRDGVCSGNAALHDSGIADIAHKRGCAHRAERVDLGGSPNETEDLMAMGAKLADELESDEPTGAGHEDVHRVPSKAHGMCGNCAARNPLQIAHDCPRGIIAGRARDPSTRMGPRATKIEGVDWRAVPSPSGHRAHDEQLVEGHLAMVDVAPRHPEGPLDVEGREHLRRPNPCSNPRQPFLEAVHYAPRE